MWKSLLNCFMSPEQRQVSIPFLSKALSLSLSLFWFIISHTLDYSLKIWAIPGLFCVYFWSFQTNYKFFTTNQCEKGPSSILRWDLNPQPLEHESSPGLPPQLFFIVFLLSLSISHTPKQYQWVLSTNAHSVESRKFSLTLSWQPNYLITYFNLFVTVFK